MIRHLRKWVALLFLLTVAPSVFAQAYFTSSLTGNQETPPAATSARGTGTFTLTDLGLQYYITVEGLSGDITSAHFHNAKRGANGGIAHDISDDFFFGLPGSVHTAHGTWTGITAAELGSLLAGDLYVNIHTTAFPGGEVRGQIDLAGGVHLTANLSGDQENPPAGAPGTGTAAFTLTEQGLEYKITATGVSGALIAAHIHEGSIGVNGPAPHDLFPAFSGGTAEGIWTPGTGLTADRIARLLNGGMYINLHTALFPAGELRGQIHLASGFGVSGILDGTQSVPPNAVPGEGSAAVTITPLGLVYEITVEGLTGPITAAHFHRAPPGSNGPVVRDITGSFVGNTARGVWRTTDSSPFDVEALCDLLAGQIYVNVHTAANPAGEIRADLKRNAGVTTLAATLSGDQEEPPSGAPGTGTGTFRLRGADLEYDISVGNLTGAIAAAHLHTGPIGTNGGVAHNLTAAFGGGNTARGTWVGLTAAQIRDLLQGNLYVNIHTAANPAGEVRGQVLVSSGCGFQFPLRGDQENPPVATASSGTGSGTLTNDGFVFSVTVDNLSGAFSAAHFHNAETGLNGGVVRDISPLFAAGHVEDAWLPSDAQPLTAGLADDLLLGHIYTNVHSAANPAGEIRGQHIVSDGFALGGALIGGAEVPPVATAGMGTASMTLTEGGLVFGVSFEDMTGSFTAAHFHNAPPGVNGPVELAITGTFANQTGRGTWGTSSGLTDDLICDLLSNKLYINIHTDAHPAGEIRTNPASLVSTDVEPAESAFSGLQLRAGPNPTSGSSVIRYTLPTDTHVRAALYDVGGALVQELFDGSQPAGSQEIRFEVDEGPAGLYFVRLTAGGRSGIARILVLR